jgi:DNA-binding NtrC family response regulator
LGEFNAQYGLQKQLSPETIARLTSYGWPGNVRELENVVRRMVLLTDGEQAFAAIVTRVSNDGHATAAASPMRTESLREIARAAAREAERQALARMLERLQWNRAEAARVLKISYRTLLNKISAHALTPPSHR